MTAFEDFVNSEIPKRSAFLTKGLTGGYDDDPNLPAAPDILDLAPLGTWFREETAAKWWRKTETAWEEQGAGPGGSAQVKASATDTTPGYLDAKLEAGSGIDFEKLRLAANEAWRISAPFATATRESMDWTLDPVAGVSPPAGTIIETQAQFDALAAPLRYGNDVERIRPYWVNHNIRVICGPGTIVADGGLPFGPGYGDFILSQSGPSTNRGGAFDFTRTGGPAGFWGAVPGTIVFAGATTDVDASVAGSVSRDARTRQHTFTRTAGTWVAGALVGKFCEILTGPLAGTRSPIYANDMTSFTIAGDAGPGAVTVRVYELATQVEGGIYIGIGAIYPPSRTPFTWAFTNLDFQLPGAGAGYQVALGCGLVFDGCYIRGFCRFDAGALSMNGCIYYADPASYGGLDSFGPSYVSIYDCWFHGGAGEVLYLRDGVRGVLGQNYIESRPGYAAYLFYFGQDCSMESMTGITYIKGNSACYGMFVWGGSDFVEAGFIVVDDCITAANIYNQPVGSLSMLTAGCQGNHYLLGVDSDLRQTICVPIGLALSATAYTVALTSAGGDITLAMLTAEGVVAGDTWVQGGYVLKF